MMRLREYQSAAVAAVISSIQSGKHPVVSLPTGSGKSLVAAAICATRPGRTLVLSHRKELLEQDFSALQRFSPGFDAGIYSAGMSRRDTENRVIFAGVASVHRRMSELGKFQTVIIDEAHLIAPQGEAGIMYNSCLSSLNGAARVGLTATPYRMGSGVLYEGDGAWFNDLAIHIKPSELVAKGYLAPLVGIGAINRLPTEGAHIRAGEFVGSDLTQLSTDEIVKRSLSEMLSLAADRRHAIIFGIDINHTDQIQQILSGKGEEARSVTSKTLDTDRADIISHFREGNLRWIINAEVLTTGFDAPLVDCIAVLRPTMSKGLHVQMMGRGMRTAPAKENCLVLDFAGNVARHGSLDMLGVYTERKTPEQRDREEQAKSARQRQIAHAIRAYDGDPMKGGGQEIRVSKMTFRLTPSKKYRGLTNLMATYSTEVGAINQWICVEYPQGGAKWHAEQWFKRRGISQLPRSSGVAIKLARTLPIPQSLTVDFTGRFPDILIEHFTTQDPEIQEVEEIA